MKAEFTAIIDEAPEGGRILSGSILKRAPSKRFREGPFRFFFFAREEAHQHVHVFSPEGEAKFRLEPAVELAVSKGISDASLKRIERIIHEPKEEIVHAWSRHFSG